MAQALENIKLLVADDDFGNAELVISFLKGLTDQVFYAPNGKKACDLALQVKPDLIVMDWQMPVLNGIEAIKILKQSPAMKDIPVIVTTGVMTSSENLKRAFDAGAVDFLRKPFIPTEFMARIESVLKFRKQHMIIREILEHEKECLEQILQEKEREITSMAAFDHQRNSLMGTLLEHLKILNRITRNEYATDLKVIEKQIESQINLEKSWEKFMLHFDNVNPDFFETLDNEHPQLSVNDRKLCAYIKMGMGNFEISKITGASDDALRKAINRLKKKLALGADQDIRKYIFNL